MALRINNATNFRGQFYATEPWVTAQIDAISSDLAGLKIIRQQTPEAGFAATYFLADKDGNNIADSAKINVLKDQFIKSSSFGWYTKSGNDYTESSKGTTGAIPCLKLSFWISDENAPVSDSDSDSMNDKVEDVYIELGDIFDVYTAGNGLDLNGGEFSVKIDSASEKVTTGASTTADVLSVSASGLKAGNIQTAIDYAVGVEETRAKAAEATLYANDGALNDAIGAIYTVAEQAVTLATTTAQGIFTSTGAVAAESANDAEGIAVGDRVVTVTSTAGAAAPLHKVIAVYDGNGNEIFPTVTYNASTKIATLKANFGPSGTGAATVDTSWTITYLVKAEPATITDPAA